MKVIPFKPPGDSPGRASREIENREMDQMLSGEMRKSAEGLEKTAMEDPIEIPLEDSQAMLDRMLSMIHADPELNAKAQAYVEESADKAEAEEMDTEELIRLGKALKESGKTLEDILGTETEKPVPDEARKRRRRWTKPAKILVGAAASFCVLITCSMSSDAMRMYWIEKLGWVFGNKPMTTVNNEEHFQVDREYTEIEALDLIKKDLGIIPIYFKEKPEGMVFDQVFIENNGQWAKLHYLYDEKYVTVLIDKSADDMSMGIVYDGNDIESIKLKTKSNIETIIHKIQRDEISTAFYAEIEYGSEYYSIIGDMEEEEFVQLIENIVFW